MACERDDSSLDSVACVVLFRFPVSMMLCRFCSVSASSSTCDCVVGVVWVWCDVVSIGGENRPQDQRCNTIQYNTMQWRVVHKRTYEKGTDRNKITVLAGDNIYREINVQCYITMCNVIHCRKYS